MRFVFFGQGFVYFRFSDRGMFFFPFSGPRLDRDMFFWTVLCFFSAFSDRGMFFFSFFRPQYVFLDWVMFFSAFSDHGMFFFVFRTAVGSRYVFLNWIMFFYVFSVCGMFFLTGLCLFPFFGPRLNCNMFFWTGLCFFRFFWFVVCFFQIAARPRYVFLNWVTFFSAFPV